LCWISAACAFGFLALFEFGFTFVGGSFIFTDRAEDFIPDAFGCLVAEEYARMSRLSWKFATAVPV
jgi:hypothetical protein